MHTNNIQQHSHHITMGVTDSFSLRSLLSASEGGQDPETYWLASLAGCESMPVPPLPSGVHGAPMPTAGRGQLAGDHINACPCCMGYSCQPLHYFTRSRVRGWRPGRNASVNNNSLIVVPVRVPVTECQTVHEFVATIQQQATEIMSHEHIDLQQIASLSADAHNACDFQTLLVMQLANDNELDDNKTLEHLNTPYALTLQCILTRKGLRLAASFNPTIVEPWLVEKMLGQRNRVTIKSSAPES
jgi:hypothetical protein